MMAEYSNASPYASTPTAKDGTLGYFSIRPVPAQEDDLVYTIEPQYENRPDLLAFDLYGNSKLWWVFTQRNMDIIEDPINDFTAGTEIYLPKSSNIKRVLGI
jgi:hypothetical protein